jgi:hypothetical protein
MNIASTKLAVFTERLWIRDNICKSSLPENGIIVMGNEANSISKELEAIVTTLVNTTFRICSNDREFEHGNGDSNCLK